MNTSVKQFVCVCVGFALHFPHLHPVSHLHKGTGRVEGPSSTGVQVGAVIVVHDLHIVHAVRLKDIHTDIQSVNSIS